MSGPAGLELPDGTGEPAEAGEWRPDGIPPRVRTAVYVAGLVVGALATAATGITAAIDPDTAVVVAAICGAVTGVVSTIASGLGVAYRPTR